MQAPTSVEISRYSTKPKMDIILPAAKEEICRVSSTASTVTGTPFTPFMPFSPLSPTTPITSIKEFKQSYSQVHTETTRIKWVIHAKNKTIYRQEDEHTEEIYIQDNRDVKHKSKTIVKIGMNLDNSLEEGDYYQQ